MRLRELGRSLLGGSAALLMLVAPAAVAIAHEQAGGAAAATASAESYSKTENEHRERYIELAIEIAADFDSPAQRMAASVLKQNSINDARLEDAVREALDPDAAIDRASDRHRVAAIDLMPYTTFSDADQVSLLLDQLVARSRRATDGERSILRQSSLRNVPSALVVVPHIVARLNMLQQPLAAALAKRLAAEDEPPEVLFAAAELTGQHGADLIPQLLAAAKSEDRFVKAAIFRSVTAMIEVKTVPSRTLEYAQRIIQRHDTNNDGVLTADEWKEMLVDPSAADTNQDGKITAEEYAIWMEQRSTR